MNNASRNNGLTLVELLIATGILLVVMSVIGGFLVTSNRGHRQVENQNIAEQTVSFLSNVLTLDFRVACYGTDSSDCFKIDDSGSTIHIKYCENRFGDNGLKTVSYSLTALGEFIRDEIVENQPSCPSESPGSFSTILLEDVDSFQASLVDKYITISLVQMGQTVPINISVAMLNKIPSSESTIQVIGGF